MARITPTAVVLVFALSLFVPALAQDDVLVPAPLPFTPDTNTFHIFASKPDGTGINCGLALSDIHENTPSGQKPYAINNAQDLCATETLTAVANFERVMSQGQGTSEASANLFFTVFVVPAIPAGTALVEGTPMTGEVTLYLAGLNANTPLTFGQVKPLITLRVGTQVIGTPWDGAPAVDPATMDPPVPSAERVYLDPFAFDFGPAPATLPAGPMTLTIDFNHDVNTQSFRFIGSRVGLAINAGYQGFFTIPFVQPLPPPPPPPTDDGEGGEGGAGGEGGSGGGTGSNNTTTPPNPTNTTTSPTNNTTSPKDKGLPGFELVAVVSAGLIAAVYAERARRRNPPTAR